MPLLDTTLDAILTGTLVFTSDVTRMSLHDSDPGSDGSNETSAARQTISWTIPGAGGDIDLADSYLFSGGASEGAVTHIGLWSADDATFYGGYELGGAQTFDTGGQYVVAAGSIDVVLGSADLPFYRPEDYGAVGDGATNDTAALQAAIDAAHAAKGGTVLLSQRYGWSGDLNIKGGVCIYQLSMPQHTVPQQEELGLVALNAAARVRYGLGGAGGSINDNPGEIRNLFIDGDNVGGSDCLLRLNCANSVIYNLRVHRSIGNGVDLGPSQNVVFYNPEIGSCPDGVALQLRSETLGQQGPGGNKFYGGHVGDSLIPLRVTSSGPEDFFPPHDNIFDGVLFETGRIAGEDIDCSVKLESGETVFRSCVFTIGAFAATVGTINEDCNILVTNDIYTGFSTVGTFDSCYFGAGAGTTKATHNVRVMQAGALNELRFYGRTTVANATYVVAMDGTTLGAGSDLVASIDGPVTLVTGGYTGIWVGINAGAFAGALSQRSVGHRYSMPSGAATPLQMRRDTDAFNRYTIDRDGGLRWHDGASATLQASIIRSGAGLAINGGNLLQILTVPTGSRPAASTVPSYMIIDSTLNKPIWSDGTNWRDATGAIV